jgi:hypothetical protein
VADADVFTDASCTARIAQEESCSNATIGEYQDDVTCLDRFVQLGSPAATPQSAYAQGFSGSMSVCTQRSVISDNLYFDVGAEIDVPLSVRSVDAVAGRRLQHIHHVFDGARYRDLFVHDDVLDLDCAKAGAADGVSRCLPETQEISPTSHYFSDAACTQPINVLVFSQSPPCVSDIPFVSLTSGLGTCAPAATIFPLTRSSFAGPLYFTSNIQPCTSVGSDVATYDVGPAIVPTAFSTATTVIDP